MGESDEPQYYYDSVAQQWWVYNTALGQWELCPESEQTDVAAAEPAAEQEQPPQDQQQHEQYQRDADSRAVAAAAVAGSADGDASPVKRAPEEAADAAAAESCQQPLSSDSSDLAVSSSPGAGAARAAAASPAEPSKPRRRGVSVVAFKSSDSSSSSSSSSSSPASGVSRQASGAESEGGVDEIGNALDRLMTTNFSRGLTRNWGSGSDSGSFPWAARGAAAGGSSGRGSAADSVSESSQDTDSPREPTPEPIVRRVTRRMTFKDMGGLAGCLQKAVQLRQELIDTEKGKQPLLKHVHRLLLLLLLLLLLYTGCCCCCCCWGHVPGAEDSETKEEAWKIRARTAAQTAGTAAREKARSLWKAAAKELAASHQQQQRTPHAGAQRFADIVTLVAAARAKDRGLEKRGILRSSAEADAAAVAAAGAGALHLSPMGAAWDRRKTADLTGRIRFADVTLTDPTNQHQVSGLLGASGRRNTVAVPAAAAADRAAAAVAEDLATAAQPQTPILQENSG
ncbi:hypothetical protein, conserved [Eimeria necatrix]|uniref:Uncharacterized protein n=1 Tax=Eimeria necatrix TaxID=51315 RepID=U6MR07_9EIME|nr:hypothetical protein, conserved [Eimeria necatrix]CDJ66461.1 hypothetical protein, conserved [Eimeria necatrix]